MLTHSNGSIMNLPPKVAELVQRQEWIARHVPHLAGRGITMSDATRKYKILQGSISLWAKRGFIKTLGRAQNDPRAVLVDEADIAYCAAARRVLRIVPGQKLFNADGTLYIPPRLRRHH